MVSFVSEGMGQNWVVVDGCWTDSELMCSRTVAWAEESVFHTVTA